MRVSKKLLRLIEESLEESADEILTEGDSFGYYKAAPDFWPDHAKEKWDEIHEVTERAMKKIKDKIKD